MRFEVRLVHAETGRRVVEARALAEGELLGSALGEGPDAEVAEERARSRLLRWLEAGPALSVGSARIDGAAYDAPGEEDDAPGAGLPAELPAAPAAALPAQDSPAAARRSAPPPIRRQSAAAQESAAAATDRGAAAAPLAEGAAGSASAAPAGAAPCTPAPEASAAEPEEAPPSDPEDWSSELTRLDLALRRLGWNREQEGQYLQRAFDHPSRSRITNYADLLAYLRRLETLESDADPLLAPVPLRRRDLLAQGDRLLGQLGWSGEQARAFGEAQLGVRSRRQLSDEQLLQFNMLLESEWLATGGQRQGPPGAGEEPGAAGFSEADPPAREAAA